jgi:hypothetical protein
MMNSMAKTSLPVGFIAASRLKLGPQATKNIRFRTDDNPELYMKESD